MLKKLVFRLTLLVVSALYLAHFVIIQGYAVNVPFWDEWEYLSTDQMPSGFTLKWLFTQHNEHRIIPTKLLTWVLYRLNGWNLTTNQTVNFLIYGLLLLMVVWFARKFVPRLDTWVILSFVIFLLSPIDWANHSWGFQSQFHFSLLFILAAIYFLYDERQRWKELLIGSAMAILAAYSLSSGLVSSFINLLIFTAYKLFRLYSATDKGERKRELRQLLVVALLVGGALALWFIGYHAVAGHPPHVLPHKRRFWTYFADILGLGFGLDVLEFLPNIFCLVIVLVPIGWEIWRKRGRLPDSSWAVYAAVAVILASLSVITIGRARFGLEQAKSSRYSEIGMMLVPLSVLSWSILLQERKRWRAYFLAAFWLFCFFTYQNNWSDFDHYESESKQRIRGLICIENYYVGIGDANCPSIYPGPLAPKLEEAHILNLSFYRDIQPYISINQVAAAQPVAGKNTLYFVDTINTKPIFRGVPVVINAKDTPDITITGWAVDALGQKEAADVFVTVDGAKDIPAAYGLDRKDVAEFHHNPRYRYSGFAVSIPTQSLAAGKHTLSLKILRTFGNEYYQPEEKIEIEVQ